MGSAPVPGPAARKLLIRHGAPEGQSEGRFDHAQWCIVPPRNALRGSHSWRQLRSCNSGVFRTSLFLMDKDTMLFATSNYGDGRPHQPKGHPAALTCRAVGFARARLQPSKLATEK